jgi:hypothetical protein
LSANFKKTPEISP